ncbi:MAG: bifunctional methylenetetrahydrofolate dehydrogenase/methenyltetrahydrofolate cyclohydrolase FolD [Clostridia bacterium]|nr:bifunctional methylenetetrahydrofolate dehydrogenase/methenyltetrahydrofolate cyclohydrolase FolD [Clostridia bacterium]
MDGKALSQKIRAELKEEVTGISKNGRTPGLAVVIVGDDPASRKYVNNKNRACNEIGMVSREYALPAQTSEAELLELVEKLNHDSEIDGILVQLPLPKGIDERKIIDAISPDKDVDAFHPENVGKIMIGGGTFLPCTPAGIMELIKLTGIDVCGKECVVVGRSNIVGKPMSMLLLAANGTVTVCHSKTENLADVTRRADILVVAVGKPEMITADMIKPGAVVIDVGMNRLESGKFVGDVEFSGAKEVAGAITPVPGGVGPMTIAMLMRNTLSSYKNRMNI